MFPLLLLLLVCLLIVFSIMPIVLPTITTLGWEKCLKKVEEIDKLKIETASLFLTGLEEKKRKVFYKKLESTNLKKIPAIHARTDMSPDELDYFIKKYKTKVFNIHPLREYPFFYDWTKYLDKVYIENTHSGWRAGDLRGFAGICIDFSHLETLRLVDKEKYKKSVKIINKNKIGMAHLSAIKIKKIFDKNLGYFVYDDHIADKNSDFDYLKNYPKKWFPKYCAIELNNSLEKQLEFKKYIEKIIC